jgi:hypothetical protein
MADAQDIADLSELIARIGQNRVTQQAGYVQKTVALSVPLEEDYTIPPAEMRMARPIAVKKNQRGKKVVNIQTGGTGGLGTYADGSTRPTGSGRPIIQGEKLPVLVAETLLFNLSEVDIADGGDEQTVDKVEKTLRAHGSQLGAFFARSLNDPEVDAPSANVASGATSMTVQDVSGYLEGQRYEWRVDATGALVGEFVAKLVVPAFDGTAVIHFESALAAQITVATESIYLKGQGDSDQAIGSIKDFTNSALDLYGLPRATGDAPFPAGIEENVGGAWSNEDGKRMVSMLKASGSNPTHWLTGVLGADKIVTAQDDNVRFIPGQGDNRRDPFHDAMVPEFAGLPIVACPQAGDNIINVGDFSMVELREHVPYGPRRKLGAAKGEFGKGALRESEDLFAFKILFDGFYSCVTERRRSFGRLINVLT